MVSYPFSPRPQTGMIGDPPFQEKGVSIMKRIISILLSLVFCLTLFPFAASADEPLEVTVGDPGDAYNPEVNKYAYLPVYTF